MPCLCTKDLRYPVRPLPLHRALCQARLRAAMQACVQVEGGYQPACSNTGPMLRSCRAHPARVQHLGGVLSMHAGRHSCPSRTVV